LTSAEGDAGWLAFFRGLVARDLSGVKLVGKDAHSGLVARRRCHELELPVAGLEQPALDTKR
jgi:transposase-like protein